MMFALKVLVLVSMTLYDMFSSGIINFFRRKNDNADFDYTLFIQRNLLFLFYCILEKGFWISCFNYR